MERQHDSNCFSPPSESDINNARRSAIKRLRTRYEAADAEDIVHEALLKFFHDPAAQGPYWRFALKRDILNAEAAFLRRKRAMEKQVSWQDQFIDTDESEPSADFANLAEKTGITTTTPNITLESARAESSTDTLLQDVMRDLRVEIDRKVLKGLYEGLSPFEIADETGEKQATIRKRIQRLRAKLRNHPLIQELLGR
jgi:RNA polymerase sigma factor (sigma-70 family)